MCYAGVYRFGCMTVTYIKETLDTADFLVVCSREYATFLPILQGLQKKS